MSVYPNTLEIYQVAKHFHLKQPSTLIKYLKEVDTNRQDQKVSDRNQFLLIK